MLQHSFVHLPGIGEQTEQRLWSQGIHTWQRLSEIVSEIFSPKKAAAVQLALEESRTAFNLGEWGYFQRRLKSACMWRLAPQCLDSIAYLDIETTGLGFPPSSHSTTIAVSFLGELFVEHEPEKKRRLLEFIQNEAKMFVTFNGLSFDIPYLRREFGIDLSKPHLDLRIWLRRLGFRGGLKKIQGEFPEIPQRQSLDINGFDAIRLWRLHEHGVSGALETLMTYNAEDAIDLEPLLYSALSREIAMKSFLPMQEFPVRKLPSITTEIHSHIYSLLKDGDEFQLPRDW